MADVAAPQGRLGQQPGANPQHQARPLPQTPAYSGGAQWGGWGNTLGKAPQGRLDSSSSDRRKVPHLQSSRVLRSHQGSAPAATRGSPAARDAARGGGWAARGSVGFREAGAARRCLDPHPPPPPQPAEARHTRNNGNGRKEGGPGQTKACRPRPWRLFLPPGAALLPYTLQGGPCTSPAQWGAVHGSQTRPPTPCPRVWPPSPTPPNLQTPHFPPLPSRGP